MSGPKVSSPVLQRILTLAAMFDGGFSIDWLISLTREKPSMVLGALEKAVIDGQLVKLDFSSYRFKDKGQQAVFSESLADDARQAYKRSIADFLLAELPDGEEKARQISNYLLDLTNDVKMCRLLINAGDLFIRSYKTVQAFQCYLKALDDLKGVADDGADQLFIEAAVKFSRVADVQFDITRTQNLLKDALNRAKQRQDMRAAALLQMHMAKNEWYRSNYTEALTLFQKGWEIAGSLDDPRLRRSALTFSTFFHYWQGYFQEAVNIYESELSALMESDSGRFAMMAESTLANCYNFIGQAAQGFGLLDTIRARSIRAGDTFMEGFNGLVMAISLINLQRFDEAMDHLGPALKEYRAWSKTPMDLICLLIVSYIHFQEDRPGETVKNLKRFLQLREQTQVSMWPYPYLLEMCWAADEKRLPAVTGLQLSAEIRLALNSKNVFMIGIARRFEAMKKRKAGGAPSEIRRLLKASENNLKKSGHVMELYRTRLLLAEHYQSDGKSRQARGILTDLAGALSLIPASMVPADLLALRKNRPEPVDQTDNLAGLRSILMDTKEPETLVQQLTTMACRMIGAERGVVLLDAGRNPNQPAVPPIPATGDLDPPRGLTVYATRNMTAEQLADPGFKIAWETIAHVAGTGEGRVHSLATDLAPRPKYNSIRSLVCAPVRVRGERIGVIYFDNRMLLDLFKPHHLEQLGTYAALIAMVVDNQMARKKLDAIEKGTLNTDRADVSAASTGGIVGQSRGLQNVLAQVRQVAATEATVMITGETGVGKELVARAIHETSRRHDGPFISINCNALPDSLISSELFGHEKGAFTGALQRRMGRFELAAGGTLFLDEIGELPHETQVKLLRVLQTREFERIGGSQTIKSDFRLLAATNRDLGIEIEAGRFRADLYYRLNIFPITVPALRSRREDIPLLARHFLQRYSLKSGKRFTSLPDFEVEKLLQYDWPGNVRELENVMERGAILSQGKIFQLPEFGPESGQEPETPSGHDPQSRITLREVEYRHIIRTLEATRWKVRGAGGAAEILDIHPSTLYSRMKKLGISKSG